MRGAAGKDSGEADGCSARASGKTGRGRNGATEILFGRMGLHRDVSEIVVRSQHRKNTGVYTSKLGPVGQSLVNSFHSLGPGGDFEGLLVMTWDAREKAYKAYAFGNDFPGALVETGQFEGNDLVFRSEFPVEGTTLKLKNVTRVTSAGKLESEEYMAMKGAPETLFVHVEAKKR
jgi:hypothetical protein